MSATPGCGSLHGLERHGFRAPLQRQMRVRTFVFEYVAGHVQAAQVFDSDVLMAAMVSKSMAID